MDRHVNLFILGVQKCGTTTLADRLSEHSEVFVPSVKECYYFPLADMFSKGHDWYEHAYFEPASAVRARWRVDATPFHLASVDALERIAAYAQDDARFVVILREPVSRAISAYKHQLRLGYETLSFQDALAAEPARVAETRAANGRWWRHAYAEVGRYANHLENAFSILGRERFLILKIEDLRDHAAVDQILIDFLDLKSPFPPAAKLHSNKAGMPRSVLVRNLVTRDNLVKRVAQSLVSRELRSRVGRSINRLNSGASPDVEILDETRTALSEYFAEDQERLVQMGIESHLGIREEQPSSMLAP